MKNIMLPDGISDSVGVQSLYIEHFRRKLFDLFCSYGYRIVIPPIVEFAESLVCSPTNDLDIQTFKFLDHVSGGMLGIRSDTTPQIARIAISKLRQSWQHDLRFCYLGDVIYTNSRYIGGHRNPMQFGVELFNCSSIKGDCEVINLLVNSFFTLGIQDITIDFSHSNVMALVLNSLPLDNTAKHEISCALSTKCFAHIHSCVHRYLENDRERELVLSCAKLYGAPQIIDIALKKLAQIPKVKDILLDLKQMISGVKSNFIDSKHSYSLVVDLTEHHGYAYQNNITFTAYSNKKKQQIAHGGHYSIDWGGKTCPAVGFSADLKQLISLSDCVLPLEKNKIFAPANDDPDLNALIIKLRQKGTIVVQSLSEELTSEGSLNSQQQNYTGVIKFSKGKWVINNFDKKHNA